jgi:hypothetical protein
LLQQIVLKTFFKKKKKTDVFFEVFEISENAPHFAILENEIRIRIISEGVNECLVDDDEV